MAQDRHRDDVASRRRSFGAGRSFDPDDAVGSLSNYPAALIRVTLERLLASPTFRRSQRHRRFLEHVIQAALAGRPELLKEVIIGIEVLGRSLPDYDPRRDPIVRVEAGRIRDKLARFYAGEGARESFEITLPIGHYMPQFVRRSVDPVGTPRPPSHALAVLPFANLSADPGDLPFTLGITDELIDKIGRLPGLRVVARISASKAYEAATDLKAIGRLLGVDHVVEGSLQRSGKRLRCIAQLARTKDSVRVWSDRFELDTAVDDDLFGFQDAIADAVLAATSMLHSPGGTSTSRGLSIDGLAAPGTANREARDLFERARYLSQQRTHDAFTKAIALLERAIEIDPSFARAFSLLGSCYGSRVGLLSEPTYPRFHQIKQIAQRALELDPLDGDARALLAGLTFRVERRWTAAEPMYRDALRVAPNSTLVHVSYAEALVYNGRYDEALQHTRLAAELDPLNLGMRAGNARIAMFARRYDLALDEFEAVLQVEPNHYFARVVAGVALLCIGDADAALQHFEHFGAAETAHFTHRFGRICALGVRGDIDRGKHDLATLRAEIDDRHFAYSNLALAQGCLGDLDGTFASLEEAAARHEVLLPSLPVHPLLEALQNDPRYAAFLARCGLADVSAVFDTGTTLPVERR